LFELWELVNGTLSPHSLVHIFFIVAIMNMPSKSRSIATAEKRYPELLDFLIFFRQPTLTLCMV
jgi:hypothetical protein